MHGRRGHKRQDGAGRPCASGPGGGGAGGGSALQYLQLLATLTSPTASSAMSIQAKGGEGEAMPPPPTPPPTPTRVPAPRVESLSGAGGRRYKNEGLKVLLAWPKPRPLRPSPSLCSTAGGQSHSGRRTLQSKRLCRPSVFLSFQKPPSPSVRPLSRRPSLRPRRRHSNRGGGGGRVHGLRLCSRC